MTQDYDIIVIGGGHAGCEAALAAARMGVKAALVTLREDRIGHMPCNPAVGGLAKGHLVKELDALGGEIGAVTDRAGIHFRMLNQAKGPAVWSPRAQCDKVRYSRTMREVIAAQPGLDVLEAEVAEVSISRHRFHGLVLADGSRVSARACVLTAGTFLRGLMHTGESRTGGGREGERSSTGLAASLASLGLRMGRLKTGTPPRVARDSVDFSTPLASGDFKEQPGDETPTLFSHRSTAVSLPQVSCYLAYSNERTHDVIRENIERSPMYSGMIEGIGPRYCPSIEDKVVRFPDRTRHQIFIEPEGLDHPELYLNGISTSLPLDVQQQFLETIPGFESARIVRPGYAVEYDFFPPDQVRRTMESKYIEGLYFAGQVNGTSGYEEAAAQGFVAGVNAVRALRDQDVFVPRRDQAYIGVMLDDLTTKEIDEPYRMFTSRAEFRLTLRQDNADERLMQMGVELGLVSTEAWSRVERRMKKVDGLVQRIARLGFPTERGNAHFGLLGLDVTRKPGATIDQVIKRPGVRLEHVRELVDLGPDDDPSLDAYVESALKYRGYVERQTRNVAAMQSLDAKRIPTSFSYADVPGLSTEARQKLAEKKPETVGQASRIAGVRASDLSIVAVYLERHRQAANLSGAGNANASTA